MNVQPIEQNFRESQRPKVLLIGNGISRAAGRSKSWETIIKNAIENNKCTFAYDDIKNMPANMQIVVASNNKVKTELKNIANEMTTAIDDQSKEFLLEVVKLPVDAILNTNYDYDIEQALGVKSCIGSFQRCRRWTRFVSKNSNDKNYNLYQYSALQLNGVNKNVWHIHGDICTKNYMIMGHKYYGSLLHQIHSYVPTFFARYNTQIKQDGTFTPKSWIDYFLLGDVYILGFGMYTTETDLWWLLDTKREHFPESKVFFYNPKDSNLDGNIKILLDTYGVEIVDDLPFYKDYKGFYLNAINDIRQKIIF